MPLDTAIEVLRKSVEPPLNIVVLWRDLEVNTNTSLSLITRSMVDGSPKMRLGTALDLLVKGLDDSMTTGIPMWRIKDDTIVIGTTATLGTVPGSGGAAAGRGGRCEPGRTEG